MNKRTLKIKAYALYWSITALIILPCLPLLLIALLSFHIPPLRNSLGEDCISVIMKMINWRRDTVFWYVTNKLQGFSLEID